MTLQREPVETSCFVAGDGDVKGKHRADCAQTIEVEVRAQSDSLFL